MINKRTELINFIKQYTVLTEKQIRKNSTKRLETMAINIYKTIK